MHYAKITDEKPTVLAYDIELRFPKCLVTGNLVVVCIAITDFIACKATIYFDL